MSYDQDQMSGDSAGAANGKSQGSQDTRNLVATSNSKASNKTGTSASSACDSGLENETRRPQPTKTIGRATAKGGGIRRETHRVKLIPTNHWDLYGTGANASHR